MSNPFSPRCSFRCATLRATASTACALAVAVLPSASATPDICWSSRATPGGHYFQVLRAHPRTDAIRADGGGQGRETAPSAGGEASPLRLLEDCPARFTIDERLASLRSR